MLRRATLPVAPEIAAWNVKPSPTGRSCDARQGGAGVVFRTASSGTGSSVHGISGAAELTVPVSFA